MAGSSIAGIVAAIASAITALAAAIGVLPALIKVLRQVKAVHVIVNQQRTDTLNYQRALIAALNKAGIDVPDDQSIPPPDYAAGG